MAKQRAGMHGGRTDTEWGRILFGVSCPGSRMDTEFNLGMVRALTPMCGAPAALVKEAKKALRKREARL